LLRHTIGRLRDPVLGPKSGEGGWLNARGFRYGEGAKRAVSEARRPLGLAVVGGLIVSQTLTLYVTPIFYIYMERLHGWTTGRPAKA
jgi:hypothetical protein